MDRLKLIEVIAAELRVLTVEPSTDLFRGMYHDALGEVAGRIADAIIRSSPGALRSLRTGGDPSGDPEGGTMPPGPWAGDP